MRTAAVPVATAPAPSVPADDNLNAVLWVQASAEYRAAAETVYRAAADTLDLALKEPHWDALVPSERGNALREGERKQCSKERERPKH